jgi:gluconate/galactonate dehydratase
MAKIVRVSSAQVQANFQWTYARVYTDNVGGAYGTGECFFAPGLPQMISELGAVLVAEDPCNIEPLVEKMRWAASGAGSLGGVLWNAISGIETALWDLKGKLLGVPVWQLLGGRFREDAALYIDCHAHGALESLSPLLQPVVPAWQNRFQTEPKVGSDEVIAGAARRAREMVDAGFEALKFDLDLPGSRFDSVEGYPLRARDIDWMIALANALRAAAPAEVLLALDAHWRYRSADIAQFAREVEGLRLAWLEDPVPPDDWSGLRRLHHQSLIPIATGENLQLRGAFKQLLDRDLCDVITPDLQKVGGLAEARKIADLAVVANKPLVIHMIGGPVALMASAHLAVTIPNFMLCEFHAYDVPFFHELAKDGTKGWFSTRAVRPPDAPGLGVEIEERIGKRWRVPGTRWFDE